MAQKNLFHLTAGIAERDAVRYTPAGLPVVSAKLVHRSEQMEAGAKRLIEFEIPSVAIGGIAEEFEKLSYSGLYSFRGFMASRSAKSKRLVFHITGFSPAE